jgi:hypothetical protein
VELIFSTGHYRNRISKSARIMCNSVGNPPRLSFSAHPVASPDSLEVFTVKPYLLDLDGSRPEDQPKSWEYSITIKNVTDADMALELVAAPAGTGITIEVPGGTIKPGDEEMVRVKIDPSVADDLFSRSFTLQASDSANTRFTVPIEKKMRWGPAPLSMK